MGAISLACPWADLHDHLRRTRIASDRLEPAVGAAQQESLTIQTRSTFGSVLIWAIIYLTPPRFKPIVLLVESKTMSEPKSLQEAIVYFSNPDNCIDYLAHPSLARWQGYVPDLRLRKRQIQCASPHLDSALSHHPKREFSIKVGTVMEDSAIPLDKWLTALGCVTNCKNGISSYEIARDREGHPKAAWFMLHRIRLAMQDESSVASWAAKSKWTKPSSAARLGTCTWT